MNFQKQFSTYNDNAYVQKEVAINLINFLKRVGLNKKDIIFEIGCGTGIFTKEIINNLSPKILLLNDICDVERYIKDLKYSEFIKGNIEEICFPKSEIVLSSSVFQWIKNFEKLIENISKNSSELGFSIYILGNLKEIKEHFNISLNYLTSQEILKILKKYFSEVIWEEESIEKQFSSPLEALKHLKQTGVTGFQKSDIGKIRSYKKDILTYKVAYFYCKKIV